MHFHAIRWLLDSRSRQSAAFVNVAALSDHLKRDIGVDETQIQGALLWGQQAVTLTAKPPSDVSLYFDCMSRPVWRIVSSAASRLTM